MPSLEDYEILLRRLAVLEREIERLSAQEGRIFVPLTTPLTSTSYDGDDTITVGTVTIDTSAVFGAPVGIKAVQLYVSAAWASANPASVLRLRTVGGSIAYAVLVAHSTNTQYMQAMVTCNANGDFDISVANADATNVVLRIVGYWL